MASGTGRESDKLCKGGANSISAAVQLAVDAGDSPADLLCLALGEGRQHGANLLHKLGLNCTEIARLWTCPVTRAHNIIPKPGTASMDSFGTSDNVALHHDSRIAIVA